jgi:hypothetical protein
VSPDVEPPSGGRAASSALQRLAVLTTIALLVIGGIVGVVLVAWSLYARAQSIEHVRGAGIANGLRLAAKLNVAYVAMIGAAALAAFALAYANHKRQLWALIATIVGSAGGIVAVHYALTIVTKLEDPRFVKKSAWVKAASSVTLAATVFFAVLSFVALVALVAASVSRYRQRRDRR